MLFIGESLLQVCKTKVLRTREIVLKDEQPFPVGCGSLLPVMERSDVSNSTDAVSRIPQ